MNNKLIKKFEEAKEKHYTEERKSFYIKRHGRLILGYCHCCGAIHEIDDTYKHDKECIYYEI